MKSFTLPLIKLLRPTKKVGRETSNATFYLLLRTLFKDTPPMNAHNLNIEEFQDKAFFPVAFYESTRSLYQAIRPIASGIGAVIVSIIALALSPLWVTILYVLFCRSNNRLRKGIASMRNKWENEPRSDDLINRLEVLVTAKEVFETDGTFKMPKKFKVFYPFFVQTRKFYNLVSDQVIWIEEKVYPTAEEIGITPEELEFVTAQLAKEDYEDMKDPDWFDLEKQSVLN